MFLSMMKSKIHRATVKEANLNYVGSITIDGDLLDQANILEGEKVQVVNVNNGSRLETYTIRGEAGSGVICLNGAAARYAQTGDIVILIAYALVTPEEAKTLQQQVVFVDQHNKMVELSHKEKHGEIA